MPALAPRATEPVRSAKDEPTLRQATIFRWIFEQTASNGYQPCYRDIAEAFGITGFQGITCHLVALEKKGWLEVVFKQTRGIRFLRCPNGSPFRGFSVNP